MRILVTGATGFVGGHLVRRLAMDGHDVVAGGRDEVALRRKFPGRESVAVNYCDVTRPDEWLTELQDIDVVVNAADAVRDRDGDNFEAVNARGACLLFDACLLMGVERVVQISCLGAAGSHTCAYYRSKRLADDYLAGLDPAGVQLDWTVLRPGLLVGRGTGLRAALAAADGGATPPEPVDIDDFADSVARLIAGRDPLPRSVAYDGAAGPPRAMRG